MPIITDWFYRAGLNLIDANSHRYIAAETWVSHTPETFTPFVPLFLIPHAGLLARAFGINPPYWYQLHQLFCERLFPKPEVLVGFQTTLHPTAAVLNPNAPEAACRLQRVGASASGSSGVGRLCLPVLSDAWYTDVPHRRHLDLATLNPLKAANLDTFPTSGTFGGRTYYKCILNKKDLSYQLHDHYELLENPVRIWQRNKIYDFATRGSADQLWIPREL